jgi:hypothetical protein
VYEKFEANERQEGVGADQPAVGTVNRPLQAIATRSHLIAYKQFIHPSLLGMLLYRRSSHPFLHISILTVKRDNIQVMML